MILHEGKLLECLNWEFQREILEKLLKYRNPQYTTLFPNFYNIVIAIANNNLGDHLALGKILKQK